MTDNTSQKDAIARIILLVYGVLKDNSPFWVFVAVKPSKYPAFQAAQKDGSLDLLKFDEYGEIIISGEGASPPEEIILKVAEMYQTDPGTFFKTADPQKEIDEKIKKLEEP